MEEQTSEFFTTYLHPDGFYIIENETGRYLNPETGELVFDWDEAPFWYSDTQAKEALEDYYEKRDKQGTT